MSQNFNRARDAGNVMRQNEGFGDFNCIKLIVSVDRVKEMVEN